VASRSPVAPTPADGRIAFLTAKMMEQAHYLRQQFDDSVSSKFFDRYLETFDPQHLHFTQQDIASFEYYRTNLDKLTVDPRRRGVADTTPACVIFNTFVERLSQRVAYVDELLQKEKFTFDDDERVVVNREDLPYANNIEEARKLWRDRLRFEYITERLTKIAATKKKLEAAAKKPAVTESKDSSSTPATAVEKKPAKSEAEEIADILSRRYHRNLKMFKEWENDDVLQIYLSALTHVYDPHSDYLGPAQLDSFSIGMNLSLFGIGAELRSEDGYCTINRLLPGGPAIKSKKIAEKDRIIAVAQSNQPPVDIVEMNLTKAVQLIRGPKGTEVRLTVIPSGEDASAAKIISLVRDEIKLEDQEAKAKIIELPSEGTSALRLGVIDLPSFYASFDPTNTRDRSEPKSTTADVAKLLTKLKEENVRGIILDLRRNGGGSLEEAVRLTGLFIKQGPVVQVRSSSGAIEEDSDDDPSVAYEGPLIVLTSRFSASASEILAGALQDYGRALIVGDGATHGKGTVQSVNALKPYMQGPSGFFTNEPGAVKVTIKKFYRASGASTQLKGVTPDLLVPSIWSESKEIGESSLKYPMPWDTIESAKFEHFQAVEPFVAELRKRSEERMRSDKEFIYIHEDIAYLKKFQADKTASLNERERLREREEQELRQKARDQERLARKEPNEKVYEITLKNALLTGLPAPVQKTNAASAHVAGDYDAANLAAVSGDASDDDLNEMKALPVDPTMREAQRILVDYVGLLGNRALLASSTYGVSTASSRYSAESQSSNAQQ
jgi:carboxyl-terminal processing protease